MARKSDWAIDEWEFVKFHLPRVCITSKSHTKNTKIFVNEISKKIVT